MIELDGYREADGPEAEALADAGGELMDLRFVEDALSALLNSWPQADQVGPDTTEARALWVASIVWYARSFKGGVRGSGVAAKLIPALSDESRATHAYALALRDKHMAHSVNVFEQVRVGVRLGPAPAFAIEDLKPLGLMMTLPTRQRVRSLQMLVQELRALMVPKMQELELALEEVLLAMDASERGRLGPVAIAAPLTTTDPAIKRNRKS
jgi:hypothetical protein